MAGTGTGHATVMDTVPRARPRGDCVRFVPTPSSSRTRRHQCGGRRGHRRRPDRGLRAAHCSRTVVDLDDAGGLHLVGPRRRRAARRAHLTRCSRVRHLAGARCYVPAAPPTDSRRQAEMLGAAFDTFSKPGFAYCSRGPHVLFGIRPGIGLLYAPTWCRCRRFAEMEAAAHDDAIDSSQGHAVVAALGGRRHRAQWAPDPGASAGSSSETVLTTSSRHGACAIAAGILLAPHDVRERVGGSSSAQLTGRRRREHPRRAGRR